MICTNRHAVQGRGGEWGRKEEGRGGKKEEKNDRKKTKIVAQEGHARRCGSTQEFARSSARPGLAGPRARASKAKMTGWKGKKTFVDRGARGGGHAVRSSDVSSTF